MQRIAGIDEVGRGCLAGPVIAAIVVLDPKYPITGLADSKKLSEKRRMELATEIKEKAMAWAVGRAEAEEIDRINILQASLLAMSRAYRNIADQVDYVRVDGNFFPAIECPGETVIKGDTKFAEISAASIIAKVTRDQEMASLDQLFPGYDFVKHKAYPTRLHLERLAMLGASEIHRRSYKPVQKVLKLSSNAHSKVI